MAYENEYVPMNKWGKDHWSTLAYVETVMVDCNGFQVGRDAHMKSNRRHFRIMAEDCPNPKRTKNSSSLAICMLPQYATILNDQQQVPNHDDWCCVQDMAAEGLFTVDVSGVEPGVVLHLSDYGHTVVSALRKHRADGGKFSNFSFEGEKPLPAPAN